MAILQSVESRTEGSRSEEQPHPDARDGIEVLHDAVDRLEARLSELEGGSAAALRDLVQSVQGFQATSKGLVDDRAILEKRIAAIERSIPRRAESTAKLFGELRTALRNVDERLREQGSAVREAESKLLAAQQGIREIGAAIADLRSQTDEARLWVRAIRNFWPLRLRRRLFGIS